MKRATGLENGSLKSRPEIAPVPGYSPGVLKEDKYGWEIINEPGVFMEVPKGSLQVDHDYQRSNIHSDRINTIARAWSWLACGTLIVARREDGGLWVIDGQHRKLAADKVASIEALPCMVFDVAGLPEEARGFLGCNILRHNVSAFDKFKAKILAGDPTAIAVRDMVQESGYHIGMQGPFHVVCVESLQRQVTLDVEAARVAWQLCVAAAHREAESEERIPEPLFSGLAYLERFYRKNYDRVSLASAPNRQRIVEAGTAELIRSIRLYRMSQDAGGAKVYARAIVKYLNKGRRASTKLPAPWEE